MVATIVDRKIQSGRNDPGEPVDSVRPLAVDFDNTLVKTDLAIESLLNDNPVLFAATDWTSRTLLLLMFAIAVLAL